MKLTFLGATETVTGSKYLLESHGKKILVDCGLFQGRKELRRRNWDDLPVDPKTIDYVVLTHAHIDHSGYLPRLARNGFTGEVLCSEATLDLLKILLPDTGHLQEEDADSANRHHYSRHHPALPLYTEWDARRCLRLVQPVKIGVTHHITPDISFKLYRAGHIPGACFIRFEERGGSSILFSGDIGRFYNSIMKPPEKIVNSDYIVLESTYGDRLHGNEDPADELGKIIRETAKRGGTVVIPSFAVGRAQSILYYIHVLRQKGLLPEIPVFLDSPMAISVTELLEKHAAEHRLSREECDAISNAAIYCNSPESSKAINRSTIPKVIISASGMATGGRILHHLKHYLGDERNTIVLPGFQAAGTRGDRLARGEKEIKIHGAMWPVHARIVTLDNMSAHADYSEILGWLEDLTEAPKKVFLTHGEIHAAQSLASKISERFDFNAIVPNYLHLEVL